MLADSCIDTALDAAQHTINALDLSLVTQRLAKEPGWHMADAKICEGLYRNFLWLMRKYGPVHGELTPSVEIDDYWHNHILFTKKYFADCQAIFGHYRHHTPQVGEGAQTNADQHFELTQKLYFKEFGEYL